MTIVDLKTTARDCFQQLIIYGGVGLLLALNICLDTLPMSAYFVHRRSVCLWFLTHNFLKKYQLHRVYLGVGYISYDLDHDIKFNCHYSMTVS